MTRSIRSVVFDAAGTLIHLDPPAADVYWRVGQAFGSQSPPDEVTRRFHQATRRHACQLGTPTSEADERDRWQAIVRDTLVDVGDHASVFRQLWDYFAEPQHWRLYDDVPAAWQYLERHNLRIAIASNFDARLEAIVQHLVPLDTASHVFYSSRVGYAKPSAQFFHKIQRELGVEPHHLVMIGDDPRNDLHVPRELGWRAWHLNRTGPATDAQTIHSLRQLDRVLASASTERPF